MASPSSARGPIIIAGGGTGGHVFPGLAVAHELKRRGRRVVFVGAQRGLEARVVPEAGFEIELLDVEGIAARSIGAKLSALVKLARTTLEARRIIARLRPAAVLGVGGYASGPLLIAAWLKRVPICLHEQNVVMGLTNRYLAGRARAVAVSFEETASSLGSKAVLTGNPARQEFFSIGAPTAAQALKVFVFGGSQGSRVLNNAVVAALPLLKQQPHPPLMVHQTGERWEREVLEGYRQAGYTGSVVPFIKEMARSMGEADLIVSRSGATSVAELAAAGRGAILVPFAAAAADHQTFNARLLEKAGAAELITEAELTGELLAKRLQRFIEKPELARLLGRRAKALARPDAAERIADMVLANCA